MTDKHDFRKVEYGYECYKCFDSNEHETILLALRIADRLQSGEISTDMVEKFSDYIDNGTDYGTIADIFKSMTAQMIKEIENDCKT